MNRYVDRDRAKRTYRNSGKEKGESDQKWRSSGGAEGDKEGNGGAGGSNEKSGEWIGEKGDSKTGRAKRTRLRKREKRGEKRTV